MSHTTNLYPPPRSPEFQGHAFALPRLPSTSNPKLLVLLLCRLAQLQKLVECLPRQLEHIERD